VSCRFLLLLCYEGVVREREGGDRRGGIVSKS
jgi:hypothetical protein